MTTTTSCFDLFSKIATDLRDSWVYWDELFYDGSFGKRVDQVAQNIAPRLFSHIRYGLLVTVLNDLAKLGDRRRVHGRDNLTLQAVYDEVAPRASDTDQKYLSSALKSSIERIQNQAFRDFRNRVLSHNDPATLLGREKHDVEIELVREAVQAVMTFFVRARAIVLGETIDAGSGQNYSPSQEETKHLRADGKRFVEVLEHGLQALNTAPAHNIPSHDSVI